MKSGKTRELPQIGWREWVALPEIGVDRIKAKVDTGARSSALHAFDIRPFRKGGRPMIRFKIHPLQRSAAETVEAEAPLSGHRLVRDSGGRQTLRPVIETTVELLGEAWPIELTLVSRDAMGFRMLLGRQALRGRFLVNAGRSFVAEKKAKRAQKKAKKARTTPTDTQNAPNDRGSNT